MQTAQGHRPGRQAWSEAAGKHWHTWPDFDWVALLSQMASEGPTTYERAVVGP